MEHHVSAGKRPLGYGALAGSRMHYGTKLTCSCREFETHTNEGPPSRTKTWQRQQERQHLAEQTPEGDLNILKRRVARAQEKLAEAIVEVDTYRIGSWADNVKRAALLLRDELTEQAARADDEAQSAAKEAQA